MLASIHGSKIKLLLPIAKMKQFLPNKMCIVYTDMYVYTYNNHMGTRFKNNYNVKRKARGGMRVVKAKKSRETPQNHSGHMAVAAT